jgi:TP901 family phage tail tape measure protein
LADRSISIALEAKVQGFVAGMRTAQQATTDFANRTADFAAKNEQHLDRVGKASMVMGGALLAGVAIAVKSFMEFDSAMSEVQASTHETAANMDLLREAAINAGADTSFSAKEAANAIDELAKAGVSTKDILSGGLNGALSLAAAGGLDVAKAAEIAATSMTIFGKNFEDKGKLAVHVADLLAAGAGKAQGSVEDMGMALNQAGLVANQTGLSIEETTGGLAAFASAGLVGSDAGTSFKSMLQRLTPQSLEAKNKMAELGISAYDAQGQFIGLSKFSENLKTSMKDLTPEARNAAMGVIFGSDAVRAANVLYENGAKGIQDWTDKVNDAGYAAVTASIKQDNLAGDLEKLGGSFDSVLIKGGSGAAEALRGIVQGAEDLVDAVGKIPAPVLNAGAGIAGIAGGGLLLGGMLLTTLPRLMEFRTSMASLAESSPRAAAGIGRVTKAAGIAAASLVALQIAAAIFTEKHTKSAEDYGQALLKVAKAGDAAQGSGLDSIFGNFDKMFGSAVSDIDNVSDAVHKLTNQDFNDVANKFVEPISNLIGLPKQEISQLEDRFKGLGEAMGGLVKNGAGETAAKNFQALTKEFERNGKGAKEALEILPGYKDALMAQATAAGVVLSEQDLLDYAMGKVPTSMKAAQGATETYTTAAGQSAPVTEDMAKALKDVGINAEGAVNDIDAFAKSLFAAGLLSLSASDASIAYQDAIDKMTESVKKNGTTLDLDTEKGRANQSTYNGLAQAAMAKAEATAAETLATKGSAAAQAELQTSLKGSYDDLVTAAGQLGITGDAADTMARKALGIPKEVPIDTWVKDNATATLDSIKGKADALNGKNVTVNINTIATTFEKRVGLPAQVSDGSAGQGAGVYAPDFIPKKANGGRVYGVGTDTSDSNLHMLSKDEYVLKASAAKAIGYGTLDQMNSQQFAPASAPARQAAPVAAGDSSGLTLTFGNLTALDPVALRRDITADVTHIINTKGGMRIA